MRRSRWPGPRICQSDYVSVDDINRWDFSLLFLLLAGASDSALMLTMCALQMFVLLFVFLLLLSLAFILLRCTVLYCMLSVSAWVANKLHNRAKKRASVSQWHSAACSVRSNRTERQTDSHWRRTVVYYCCFVKQCRCPHARTLSHSLLTAHCG